MFYNDKIGLNADINLNTNDSEIIFEKLSKLFFQDEILIGISEKHENINNESIILNVTHRNEFYISIMSIKIWHVNISNLIDSDQTCP